MKRYFDPTRCNFLFLVPLAAMGRVRHCDPSETETMSAWVDASRCDRIVNVGE